MPASPDGSDPPEQARHGRHALRLGRHRVGLPRSRVLRLLLGVMLVFGGLLAFLPVLGLWMLPLGVIVLSVDLPPVRRLRRRAEVRWGRSAARERLRAQWRRVRRFLK